MSIKLLQVSRPLLRKWRWWCWVYRSAAGGWIVVLLGHWWHLKADS